MKANFKLSLYAWCVLFSIVTIFSACKKTSGGDDTDTGSTDGQFVAWVRIGSSPNTTTFAIQLSSLEEGVLSYQGKGVETDGKLSYNIIARKGKYYYHGNGRFGKYHISNNVLVTDQEVPFTAFTITAFAWRDDNNLMLFGVNGDANKALYAVVDVTTMKITTGELALPALPADYNNYRVSLTKNRNDGKLFLVYGLYNSITAIAEQKVRVAVLNNQTFAVEKTIEDSRTAVASTSGRSGLTELYQPYSFIDEGNNIYFGTTSTSTGINSVLYRIKSGTTDIDASYDVYNNATNIINGLWYLGNGKAILRTYNKEYGAYEVEYLYEYYELTLSTGAIKKLSIPKGRGHYSQNLAINGTKAYIITNKQEAGDGNIWIYDIPTGTVKAGMSIPEGYSYLLRLDNLN